MARADAGSPVLEVLEQWGIDRLFICPGSTEASMLSALAVDPGIDPYIVSHESVAVSMADGLARATGRPAVAYLHANVGMANGVAHLHAAHVAKSPVTILNGVKTTEIQNRGGFTTSSHMRDHARQYVKGDWEVRQRRGIAEDVNRALRVSFSQPTGPTWVGIPQDLLEGEDHVPVPRVSGGDVLARSRSEDERIRAAAEALGQARRPVLVAGSEVWAEACADRVTSLAERLEAPVFDEDRWTLEAACIPTSHPHHAGLYNPSRGTIEDADAVFFIGSRGVVEFDAPRRPPVPPGATILHLSSDSADIDRVFASDVALVGTVAPTLVALEQWLEDPREVSQELASERADHLARARKEHHDVGEAAGVKERPGERGQPLDVASLMGSLVEECDESTVLVDDSTTSRTALLAAARRCGTVRGVLASVSGSLGWGMGAALGVKLGLPDARVMGVVGDGVCQFGLPALWTAAKYRIPVTFVVVNNESYAAVGAALRRYGDVETPTAELLGKDLSGVNLATIASGFGLSATRVNGLEEFRDALAGADADEPALVEVMTDPEDLGP